MVHQVRRFDAFWLLRQFALAQWGLVGRISAVQLNIATGAKMKVPCPKPLRQP